MTVGLRVLCGEILFLECNVSQSPSVSVLPNLLLCQKSHRVQKGLITFKQCHISRKLTVRFVHTSESHRNSNSEKVLGPFNSVRTKSDNFGGNENWPISSSLYVLSLSDVSIHLNIMKCYQYGRPVLTHETRSQSQSCVALCADPREHPRPRSPLLIHLIKRRSQARTARGPLLL